MIRVGSIVLRVDDLQRQAAFWAAALDYLPRDEESDNFVLLRILGDPDGNRFCVVDASEHRGQTWVARGLA
jgi:hypothetical protein